jgi:CBS domain containing-hemolysin-like protein
LDPDGSTGLQAALIYGGLIFVGILLVAFAAAAEMAFASLNRVRFREAMAGRKDRLQTAEVLLGEPARLLATLMVVKLIGTILVIAGALLEVGELGRPGWAGWWLLVAFVLLLATQVLARAWTVGRQQQVAAALAPMVSFAAIILTPVTWPMRKLAGSAVPAGAAAESIFLSEDGLRLLLDISDEESIIEEGEKEMIASIFEFGDKLVREVMVPRIDLSAVPVEASMLDALDIILKEGHSRIPAYRDTIDNVVGILYAKDLLRYLRDGRTEVPLSRILRPAYFIPESKRVQELLAELQLRRVHMAVVVDEYGGTAGAVTIEDLLEEIVGEIQDEYDAEEPTVEEVAEREFVFDARVNLDEVSKLLGVELPDDGGDTLGGFIYSQLGKVPAVGDQISWEDATFEVLSVAGRRIQQVRAGVAAPEEAGAQGQPA